MDNKLGTSIQTLKQYCKNTRCKQCEIGKVIKCVRVYGEVCVPSHWSVELKNDKKERIFDAMKEIGVKKSLILFLVYNLGIAMGVSLGCALVVLFDAAFITVFEQSSVIYVMENMLMWCGAHLYIVLPILFILYITGYMWMIKNYKETVK